MAESLKRNQWRLIAHASNRTGSTRVRGTTDFRRFHYKSLFLICDSVSYTMGPRSTNRRKSIRSTWFQAISITGFDFVIFIAIGVQNYIQIGQYTAELWRHNIDFYKTAAGSHVGFRVGNISPFTKCAYCACSLVFKSGVHRIYNVGDITILRFWRFALNLPIHVIISAAYAQNQW